MVRQEVYLQMLKSVDGLKAACIGKQGKKIADELVTLEVIETCLHANLIRSGAQYYLTGENVYSVGEADASFSISKDELLSAISDHDFELFDNELREDGRVLVDVITSNASASAENKDTVTFTPAEEKNESVRPEKEVTSVSVAENGYEEIREDDDNEAADAFINRIMSMTKETESTSESIRTETFSPVFDSEEEEYEKAIKRAETKENEEKDLPSKKYTDVREIKKADILQYYAAFTVYKEGRELGRFELIAAPLDPKKITGKFGVWIKKHKAEKAYVNVSDGNGKRKEEVVYTLFGEENIALTLSPAIVDGRYTVSITGPEGIQFSYKKQLTVGTKGHIVMIDEDNEIALHVFPTLFSKNADSGYASYYCVIESDTFRAVNVASGSDVINVGGEELTVRAKWKEDTLYASIS